MEISERLLCVFSEQIKHRDGSYVIEIPKRELELGALNEGGTYQVAVMPTQTEPESVSTETPERVSIADGAPSQSQESSGPPVVEGETRSVEIEDIGEQGDGIARVERGFVVIVPEAEQGERVRVEITNVRENVAFADVVEREAYYE